MTAFTQIEGGGVTSALGFKAAGVHAGFRKEPERRDLALVVADEPCAAAGTFTKNIFCSAPVIISREHLSDGGTGAPSYGTARAVVVNSGIANAATGVPGLEHAREMARITADAVGCTDEEVLVASTGVIGQHLPLDPFKTGVPQALAEAMPWIKNITGKTIVIKYGGSAMVDEQLRAEVMADIVLLKIIGVNPVIVHGGGLAISEAMKRFDMPVKFIDGQRVTTDAAMKVVRSVLAGQVNQELVEAMNEHGRVAVGLSGADGATIIAEQASEQLGRVGRVVRINSQLLEDLVSANYIPVLASVGIGEEPGSGFFNVNADVVAGHVAAAIGAHKVFFLTDVDGLYRDFDDKSTLISRISLDEVREMVDKKQVSTGMIPKLRSCIRALDAGVHRAHILNGTTPHALLLEMLTDKGVGTMIVPPDGDAAFDSTREGSFASKLV